jgi:TolA-binding protein
MSNTSFYLGDRQMMILRGFNTIGLMILLALVVLPCVGRSDTTFVNVDLVPSGTLTGSAQGSGLSDHSGIFVYVGGTSIVGATDASGDFTIIGVPYGNYTLTFTKPGFQDQNSPGISVTTAGATVIVPAVVLDPSSVQDAELFGQAMRLYAYNRFNDAIAALRAVADLNPSGPYAAACHYRVGLAFGQQGEYDSAITAFSKVITDYGSDSLAADSYYWRGAYKDQKLDFAGALSDFQHVLTNYATYKIAGRAQYREGREYEELADYTQAISSYLDVETNYPSSPDIAAAILNAGWLYYTSDQYTSAIAEFDKLLTSHSQTSEAAKASYYKGLAYYNQEDFTSAIAAFTASITNYPQGDKMTNALYYRAHCKYQLEAYSFAQAEADYQYIVDNYPNSEVTPHARYYLGSCEYERGNGADAIAFYQSYIAAEPTNDWVPNAYYKIANANYFVEADYASALTAYQTYYGLYPDGKSAGEAHYWAGRCHEKLTGSTDNVQAQSEYCTVMSQYPNCSKAADAADKFATVGGTTCP